MLKWIVSLALALSAERAMAEPAEWELLPGMTSAQLSASEWEMEGSSGLSWDDGKQAVISFWNTLTGGLCVPLFSSQAVGFLR